MAFLYNFAVDMLGRAWKNERAAPARGRSDIPTPPPRKRMRLWVEGPALSPPKSQSSSSEDESENDESRGYVKKKHKRVKTAVKDPEDDDEDELHGTQGSSASDGDDDDDDDDDNSLEEDEEADALEDNGEDTIMLSVEETDEAEEQYNAKRSRPDVQLTGEQWAAERERRIKAAHSTLDDGWTASEQALFNKLNMRGFEPLLPSTWRDHYEFSALPDNLFDADSANAYLNNKGRAGVSPSPNMPVFCLKKALDLGPRMRCATGAQRNHERTIRHALDTYIKWGLRDTGLTLVKDRLPIVVIVQKRANESAGVLQEKLVTELEKLEKKWRKQLGGKVVYNGAEPKPFPQLYGIILMSSIMGLLSYIPEDRRAQPSVEGDAQNKNVLALHAYGLFNFIRMEYDVWNGLAMSIIAVHLRNELSKAYHDTGLVEELGFVEESDPDL